VTETAAAFERHLLDNIDDVAGWSAYADYLTEQGDPRGDFMRVQLALEDETLDKAARKALRQEEEALRAGHLDLWLGEEFAAASFTRRGRMRNDFIRYTFQRGWIWKADGAFTSDLPDDVFQYPSWRWLQKLKLETSYFTLGNASFMGVLRDFQFGEGETSNSGELDGAAELVGQMSRVERVSLACAYVDTRTLFGLPLWRLCELHVHCQTHYATDTLADNPAFAGLRILAFHPHANHGDTGSGSYLNAGDMRLICNSPHLAGLEHLQLNCVAGGDDAVTALIDSGRILTLKSLDLTHGSVTDDGAQRLAAALTAHPHRLDRLVLKDNALSAAGVAALSAVPSLDFDAGEQHAPGDTEYLTQGDIE
jgi:uncharacterized protein (TIGR02996 family)